MNKVLKITKAYFYWSPRLSSSLKKYTLTTRFATEKGIFFAVDKAGSEESRETALAFECSVVHRYEKSETLKGNETSSSGSEEEEKQESVLDPVVYVRRRRTKGNRYHLVMASLLSD